MKLPELPTLPKLVKPQLVSSGPVFNPGSSNIFDPGAPGFLGGDNLLPGGPSGGAGSPGGGGGFPAPGGISINLPGSFGGSTSGAPFGFVPTAAALASSGCSWYDIFCVGADQILRVVLFFLGFICIIGAIYLYRPTNSVVMAPVRAVKGAAKTAIKGAVEAASA